MDFSAGYINKIIIIIIIIKNMHADWFKIVFCNVYRNTELTQAVDAMMTQAKKMFILMIKVIKFFLFLAQYFLKDLENMLCAFLFVKVCGNTCLMARVPTAFLVRPN